MKRWIGIAIIALGLATAALAEDTTPPEQFQPLITQQLGALQNGDANTAYGFADAGIKRQFGSPERFYRMVQQGYRPLIDFTVMRFEEARDGGDAWIQPIWLRDSEGDEYMAYYAMRLNSEDQWRIAGVQLTPYQTQAF
ncbi:MAG TPA: DUF4864 domain-containing protein [Saccharospirillum sp.]|nr:DUF4864 domain-containing protein [Saccharospirillum sp.]